MLRAIHPHRSALAAARLLGSRLPNAASSLAHRRSASAAATAVHTEIMDAWATKGTRPPRKKLVELGQAVSEEGDAALVIEAHRRYCLARHEMNSKRSGKLLFRACLAERNWEKVIELLAGAPRHQVFFSEWTPAREIFGAATADGDWARLEQMYELCRRAGAAATHDEAGFVLKALAEAGEFDAAARTLARVPAGLLRPTAAAKLLHALVDAAEAARVDEADGADEVAAAAVAALPELERAVEFTSHKLVAIAARASLLADDPAAALAPLVARSSARTIEKARKRLETATGGGHDAAIALLE
jgi:hypothetical protein